MTKFHKWEGILGLLLIAGIVALIAISTPESSPGPWVQGVGTFLMFGGVIFFFVARPFYWYGQIKGRLQPDVDLIETDKEYAQRSAKRARKRLARLDP